MKNKMKSDFILYEKDMPNMATHKDQNKCGYSVHRGVLVQWDEDHDRRILDVLDKMFAYVVVNLLAVQEHEGSIAFIWCNYIPFGYEEGADIEVPDGDIWSVISSVLKEPPSEIPVKMFKNGQETKLSERIE